MTHSSRLMALAILFSVPAAACDKASEDQVTTTGAQVKANNEIQAANAKAAQEDRSARATEDKTIAAASADFAKLRDDYRRDTQTKLDELGRKVTALERKSTAGVDTRLTEIHADRVQFDSDLQALGYATESTWDGQRAALDKKLADMNALADQVSLHGWDRARP